MHASPAPPPARARLAALAGIVTLAVGLAGGLAAAVRTAPPAPAMPPAPPRLADVELVTGVRLRFAEQGDLRGPAVILLHGTSDSWFSFSRVLPMLPGRYRVYALDQRGHGDSERPFGGYAMRDLAADVIAFMDAKRIERATIVGHSMGGLIAQEVVRAAPERVERLVLVSTATGGTRFAGADQLREALLGMPSPDAPVSAEFAREFQQSTVHVPVPPAFMDTAVATSLKLPVRVWRALLDGMLAMDATESLERHRIPTLVLWGEHDPYVPRAEQDALVKRFGTASLVVYPGTGHALHWERPAAVTRDIVAFLER